MNSCWSFQKLPSKRNDEQSLNSVVEDEFRNAYYAYEQPELYSLKVVGNEK